MKINPATTPPPQTQSDRLKPYRDIAEGMETTFTSHMLEQMKKTVQKENPDSTSMDYYNSMLDYERAKLMAQSESGLGVKEVILEQIVPSHLKKTNQGINGKAVSISRENKHE